MDHDHSLAAMASGERAVVTALYNTGGMRRRLLDIGLIEGTEVECLGRSPGGDPAAYLIRGAVIAIRSEDGGKIRVRACKEAAKWI
ncbi:MAG: FeoA family protein [Clostridia bacterium]|nr:FeoA family protein [Clostridia bacterium]